MVDFRYNSKPCVIPNMLGSRFSRWNVCELLQPLRFNQQCLPSLLPVVVLLPLDGDGELLGFVLLQSDNSCLGILGHSFRMYDIPSHSGDILRRLVLRPLVRRFQIYQLGDLCIYLHLLLDQRVT